MKRFFMVILTVVLMLSFPMQGMAAQVDDSTVSPCYTYISTNKVGISINETTGVAECSAYCYTVGQYTVEVECRLQRYTGYSWSTIKTWSASNTRYASISGKWAVYSGYNYRAYALFCVRDSSGNLLESTTSIDSYAYPAQ